MNNNLTFLFCITVLALAPACSKKNVSAHKQDVNTMIELDNSIMEMEEDIEPQKSIAKF